MELALGVCWRYMRYQLGGGGVAAQRRECSASCGRSSGATTPLSRIPRSNDTTFVAPDLEPGGGGAGLIFSVF